MPSPHKMRTSRQSRSPQRQQPLRGGTARQGRLFNPSADEGTLGAQGQLFNVDDPDGSRTFVQPGGDESAFNRSRPSPTRTTESERDREERRRRRLERRAARARQRGSRLDPRRSSRGRTFRR